MDTKERCNRGLKKMRESLHSFVNNTNGLIHDLNVYADELDAAYKDMKIAKVAGGAGCVVGGILGAVGFGLSFATFGASLCLCIAGGVIGGMGGITTGGAAIADFVKAKKAREMANSKYSLCEQEFTSLLEQCKQVSEKLEKIFDIDIDLPRWKSFWGELMIGFAQVAWGFGWKTVAHTVINAISLGKGIDVAVDATSAAFPVFRTLGNVGKGFHIVGGVFGALFLPYDISCLIKDSIKLHTDEGHEVAQQIRNIASKLKEKRRSRTEVDMMIDECLAAVYAKDVAM